MAKDKYAWTPQAGTQAEAICARWCDELFFGGARGGGKTSFLLGDFLQDVETYGVHWQGILFRRSVPELEEVLKQAKEMYLPLGAEFAIQKATWKFPNGATLKLRHLERHDDADKYQGHQYTWIGWDELTNWADLYAYNVLKACLRSAKGVDNKRIRATGNPGGRGHHAVKEYFVDPAPKGMQPIKNPKTGAVRMFIKSRVTDNKILLEKDPSYVDRLRGVGTPELVRAWLDGDWEAIQGAFFNLTPQNFCQPFQIPEHWAKYIGQDWGYRSPFASVWLAISSGVDDRGKPLEIPKGSKVIYRCISQSQVENTQQAQMVFDASVTEKIRRAALDPACWSTDGSKTIAQQMNFYLNSINSDWWYQPAINNRVAGWSLITEWINKGELIIFNNLANLIEPMKVAPISKKNAEDVDTECDDHALDALRYASMQYMADSVYSEEKPYDFTMSKKGINLAKLLKEYKERKKETRL